MTITPLGLPWGCSKQCGVRCEKKEEKAFKKPRTASSYTGPIVDAHTHVSPRALAKLLDLMSRHGISHAVNFSGGVPSTRVFAANRKARDRSDGRMSLLCNLPWSYFARHPDFVTLAVRLLRSCKKQGGRGLKINKVLGLGVRDRRGRLVAVDDPRLDPIFAAAGRLGLPVAIHVADPKAFWQPPTRQNERFAELQAHPGWSYYGKSVPSWQELQQQFRKRVRRNKNTQFVGVHFGNAAEEPDRVARLLKECPNLFIDTAARIPEMGRHPPARMRRFFTRYQDRIVFGTDLGVGPNTLTLGSSGTEPPKKEDVRRFFKATWRYFESKDRNFAHPTPIQGDWTIDGLGLPPPILRKVYCANAARLYRLDVECR